jgi:hypothetical protein
VWSAALSLRKEPPIWIGPIDKYKIIYCHLRNKLSSSRLYPLTLFTFTFRASSYNVIFG